MNRGRGWGWTQWSFSIYIPEEDMNNENELTNPAQPTMYDGPYYHLYGGGCSGMSKKEANKTRCQNDDKCKAIGLQSNNCWHFLSTPENKSNSWEKEKNIANNYPKHFEKIR
jgi:hypothetical protein